MFTLLKKWGEGLLTKQMNTGVSKIIGPCEEVCAEVCTGVCTDTCNEVLPEEPVLQAVQYIPFKGLVLYDGMAVSLSVKITVADNEYRILARRLKPNSIQTKSGFIDSLETIDPISLNLGEDVTIQVVEVFYKLKNYDIFVRCDLTSIALSNAKGRAAKIPPANELVTKLQSLGFVTFKSEKYGDLFVE